MARWSCPDCGWTKATTPRWETRPTSGADHWLADLRRAAPHVTREGFGLMPWQLRGGRLLTELRGDGLPRWKTVVASVPRQQGKTVLSRAAVKAKADSAPNLEIFGTAQSRQYAAGHVVKLGRVLGPLEAKTLAGVGAESVTFNNGTTFRPISPTDGGGHGDSIDFMLVDEGWKLSSVTLGGVGPALIARPHSQMLIISTMGTLESTVWNGIVRAGRESTADPGSDMAYLEYAAATDEDVWDEDLWHRWMPALGRGVAHRDIRAQIDIMLADPDQGRSGVVRAFGNRTTAALVTLFPSEWVGRAWRVIQPPERMVLAVDVDDDPAGATISSGHLVDGGAAVRTIEWRAGTPRWVPGHLEKILDRRTVDAVAADFGGPAKAIQAELTALCEAKRVPLVARQPTEVGADTQRFYDALREQTIYLEPSPPLAEAITAAQKKPLGELWVVSRQKMIIDASPLIAGIMAHGTALEMAVTPVVESFVL